MEQIVYLNGEFLPIARAQVSVLDRGFIFGDGVYEVIPVYSRHPFRLGEHITRLQQSLAGLRLADPLTTEKWQSLVRELVARNAPDDQSVYIQLTRGATPAQIEEGVTAISARDIRWDRCDIKAVSLLPNVLLRQLAMDAGAAETVLFRDGMLTEGAASNIFAVERGTLLAPPKDNHMLPGITYDLVLELAEAHAVAVEIGHFPEARIRAADELWITSSTREVLAVVALDGQPVGNGEPGPLYRRMYGWYQDYKQRVMRHGETAHG